MFISYMFDSNLSAVSANMVDNQQDMEASFSCHFDVFWVFFPGYLSSPHADQEPPFARDSQQGPVISSPVVPAAASGTGLRLGFT